jgi:hypothetical protein
MIVRCPKSKLFKGLFFCFSVPCQFNKPNRPTSFIPALLTKKLFESVSQKSLAIAYDRLVKVKFCHYDGCQSNDPIIPLIIAFTD